MKRNRDLLITIVIPNYNNSKFIIECLESVVSQDYPGKEIIVVDDGSTDDSVDKIRKYIGSHKKMNIKLLQQKNSGATVARNKGINKANGEYIIFLDSDDLLVPGILSKLAKTELIGRPDLIVGGYLEIDEAGDLVGQKSFGATKNKHNGKELFAKLINVDPVPSNKVYKSEIIKNHKLKWNNVKIGQDLDFYLRYLALCDTVVVVEDKMYKYRFTTGSISRSYDFRIFDITKVFSNVKEFYVKNNMIKYYDAYMPLQILRHFNFQLSKQIYFKNRDDRRKIVKYFFENENKIDYTKCLLDYKKLRNRFYRKCVMEKIITSNIYCASLRTFGLLKKKMKYILKPTRGKGVA